MQHLRRITMRTRLTVALCLVVAATTGPVILAEQSLALVHQERLRADHASQALARYLKLCALGYQIERQLAEGKLTDPKARQQAIDAVREQIHAVHQATRDELDIIGEGGFDAKRRQEMIGEESVQQEMAARLEESLLATINGMPDHTWQKAMQIGMAGEEQEVRDSQLRAVQAFQSTQLSFLAVAIIIALAAAGSLWWFRSEVFRPLENLLRATRRVADGDLTTSVPLEGPHEFLEINHSFNAMAERLAASAAIIEADQQRLEQEVGRRTAQLAQANLSLARLNELRRDFLADTSHELRTPLAVLTSEIDTALMQPESDVTQLRASLRRAGRTTQTLQRLVEDLLQVARAEAPLLPVDCVQADLVQLVHECVEDFRTLFAADGGSIALAQAPDRLIANIDRPRIAQVLRIFVDNALKHSSDAPRVAFTVGTEGDMAVIAVSDEGDGIAEADIPALLDRFRRPNRNSEREGLGLGLAIAATIAAVHRGSIAIASQPGAGTTVTLRLPVDGPWSQAEDAVNSAREAS